VAGAWACAWLSFRALKSKFPGVWCLIIIGPEGPAELDLVAERRHRARGALATALQAEPSRSERDFPDPWWIAQNLIRYLASLNRVEMLPWDV
jgi:hypothetical protein